MAPRGSKKRGSYRESNDRRRPAISPFNDDDDFGRRSSFPASFASLSSTNIKMVLLGLGLVVLATFVDPSTLFGGAASQISQSLDEDGKVGDALPHVTKDGKYHGRYPNSLLTLFYPFTLLRDVVLDQPVNKTDVPFFWHAHVSDESAVKRTLKECYGADLIELDTVEDINRAKHLELVSTLSTQNRLGTRIDDKTKQPYYNGQSRRPVVITSPHIRETAELFNQDHYGRVFSFYRHPIDYDVHPQLKQKLPPEAGANNFMTRLLSDVHVGELGYKELGIAKQVIRQVTVAGARDVMAETLFRIGKYFGWIPVSGLGTKESEEEDDAAVKTCINEIVQSSPEERYADHNSPEWKVFYQRNLLDCQLYEIARSTWRAQIQTIIPLTLQKQRAGEGDEEEEEEKEKEGERT